jgi:hypothetical protein
MTEGESVVPSREARPSGRFWLFAPYILLVVLAGAWSALWFVLRGQSVEGLDAWLGRERAEGRVWNCPDRSVAGYPFRVEVSCPALSVAGPGFDLALGRVSGLTQIYQRHLVLVEAAGPLRLSTGGTRVEGTWSLLQTSLRTEHDALDRLSVAIDNPAFTVAGPRPEPLAFAARHLEAHLRPSLGAGPSRPAFDTNLAMSEAVLRNGPDFGIRAPADVDVVAKVTGVPDLALSPAEAAEGWRRSEGRVELGRLKINAGELRVEGTGELSLDDLHRPAGRLELSGAGIEGPLQALLGPRGGLLGGVLGALAGKPQSSAGRAGQPTLKPLPTVRVEEGRVYIGPLPLPSVRLAPLY